MSNNSNLVNGISAICAQLALMLALAPPALADNLGHWLKQAQESGASSTKPIDEIAPAAEAPLAPVDAPDIDAPPGVIELSDGTQLAGLLVTTDQTPWMVWVEQEQVLRRIPPLAVLSITAQVVEEGVEQSWRWKAMGVPERVYTGEEYPVRRLLWQFKLADGSEIVGAVKGQPISVRQGDKLVGPFVLHERMKGSAGQELENLIYVRKVVVSREMMLAVERKTTESVAASMPSTEPS